MPDIPSKDGSSSEPKSAVRALTDGLFDYAGLYPPAALTVVGAVAEYHRLLHSRYASWVGPFVVDVPRVAAVHEEHRRQDGDGALTLSVLCGLNRDFATDVAAANRFVEAIPNGETRIVQIESRIDGRATPDVVVEMLSAAATTGAPALFLEVDPAAPDLFDLARIVAEANRRSGAVAAALKIRCGGIAPDAVPPVKSVVDFLFACQERGLRFKATAGLHHPVRAFHDTFGGYQHGFLNLWFAAGTIASWNRGAGPTRRGDEDARGLVERILLEENPAAFSFDDDCWTWRDVTLRTSGILELRHNFATSIGSCSIAEPAGLLTELIAA